MSKKAQSVRAKAFSYFIKGLTNAEIAKLLDLSPRTVEGYSQIDRWREKDMPLRDQIASLRKAGFKVREVAERVGLSQRAVERHLKAHKADLVAKSNISQ